MKIAVVTIAKNEAQFVERWAMSANEADLLLIGDTGSTDDTRERASARGVQYVDLAIEPWRFDDARNALLAMVPTWIDVIVTLDMDEVLLPGWRSGIESAGEADRYRYHYQWSPEVEFIGERCVSRDNWRWKHPVHESLQWVGDRPPVEVDGNFAIAHLPDDSKPRSQYLGLLRKAVLEDPHDDRIAHYYARELFFAGQWDKARTEFVRHLALPSAQWADERAQSYRYLAKMDDFPERWILKAIAEAPHRREPWLDWAKWLEDNGHFQEALGALARVRRSTVKPLTYISDSDAWDDQYLDGLLRQILEKAREDAHVP